MRVCFYISNVNAIGGIESWLYYIGKLYAEKRDIFLYYEEGDPKQIERLEKNNIRCRLFYNQKIKCDVVIFCFESSKIDYFNAKRKIQFTHAVLSNLGYKEFKIHPDIDEVYSVSSTVAKDLFKLSGVKSDVVYNPICLESKKLLKLISATRITEDKGGIWERMQILGRKLNKENIPFIWLVFTNNTSIKTDIKGIVFMKPELDITSYIKESDYLVQLSKSEGYCYSVVESLALDTAVLITNFDAVDDIGVVDGENGYIFNMDMSNVNVDKIYNKIPKNFKYICKQSNDKWLDILGPECERSKEDIVKVRCCFSEGFTDSEFNKRRLYNETWNTTRERANFLENYRDENFTKIQLVDIIE